MKEEKDNKKHGDPNESFKLSEDLMKALRDSDSFKNGANNTHVMFDIMMGIAMFTEQVLCAMEVASRGRFSYHDFYYNEIMEHMPGAVKQTLKQSDIFPEEAVAS